MDVKIKTSDIKFKFRVSGIIIENNKILLEKYDENSYCLPGGYVNIGENSEDAIHRELKEEIKFDFILDEFLGIAENFFTNFKGDKTHGIDFYYKASFKNKDDIDNIDYDYVEDDHGYTVKHSLKWFDLEELRNINLRPEKIKEAVLNSTKNFHYIINDN